MKATHTNRVAEFVAKTPFEAIPKEMLWTAKRLILDTLGVAIGGHATSGAKRVLKTVAALGGAPESTVFVTGHRTSPPHAVFANASLATALLADDSCLLLGHHGQSSILPALALSEQRTASGSAFLGATAIAYEASARIASAARHMVRLEDGTLRAAPAGGGESWIVFAAAFSAGRLAGLDSAGIANAMGIAGYTASLPTGARWNRPDFNNVRHNPYPFTAQNGTMAVLLTENGFTGDRAILDADASRNIADWWTMAGILGTDVESALRTLGSEWLTLDTSFKPYPACRFLNGPISLFADIVAEQALVADDIERVDVLTDGSLRYLHMDDPTVGTEEDCQFSMPHALAMIALNVRPGPEWISPRYWKAPEVEAFKLKVNCDILPSATEATISQLLAGRWVRYPHKIRVSARGKTYERSADYVAGDPFTPETLMTDEALFAKFRNFVDGRIAVDQVDRCIETVMTIEKQQTLRSLIDCLH
jgi:2-methylcitrate dehydratase PrpD